MNIRYNESDKSIEIDDDLKSHYFLLKIVLALNLGIAGTHLYKAFDAGTESLDIGWMLIGSVCLIALYFVIFKKSTRTKIPLNQIKDLQEKTFFGRKRYSIKLIGGKQRDLITFKNNSGYEKLREIIFNNRF